MSSNGQALAPLDHEAAVIVVNFPMPAGYRFDWHVHQNHQLAWAPRGVLSVVTERSTYVLPPTRGLWIPAGVRHETRSAGHATMRALYVRPERVSIEWTSPTAVAVSPLLAELIAYLGDEGVTGPRRDHAESVLVDQVAPVAVTTIDVPFPTERPASTVAEALAKEPSEPSTLAQWGRRVAASERTLARSFLAQTGLSFGRWRTLIRLQTALPKLAAGNPVSNVAIAVGYETTSAFVAAFHRETGITPANYFDHRDS